MIKNVMKVNDKYFIYIEPLTEDEHKYCSECAFSDRLILCATASQTYPCQTGNYQEATERDYLLFRLRGPE